jgi:hypothetical protein
MKASVEPKYTVENINYYPAGGTAVAIAALLGTVKGFHSCFVPSQIHYRPFGPITPRRDIRSIYSSQRPCLCRPSSCSFIQSRPGASSLPFIYRGKHISVPHLQCSSNLRVSYAGQASNFGWCNDLARDDDQERSVILAAMNSVASLCCE